MEKGARDDLPEGYVDVTDEVGKLPESYPYFSGDRIPQNDPINMEEEEMSAAHSILDELGVPNFKEFLPSETAGGVSATHLLRLHGRLKLLKDRVEEQGIEPLFTEEERPTPIE